MLRVKNIYYMWISKKIIDSLIQEFEAEYESVRVVILNVTGQEGFTAEYSNQSKIE